jgi:hypothetical protein
MTDILELEPDSLELDSSTAMSSDQNSQYFTHWQHIHQLSARRELEELMEIYN